MCLRSPFTLHVPPSMLAGHSPTFEISRSPEITGSEADGKTHQQTHTATSEPYASRRSTLFASTANVGGVWRGRARSDVVSGASPTSFCLSLQTDTPDCWSVPKQETRVGSASDRPRRLQLDRLTMLKNSSLYRKKALAALTHGVGGVLNTVPTA